MRLWIAVALVLAPLAFAQNAEPTVREIEAAYRSTSGEGGTFIPNTWWERRRVKEIRGWRLRFKRLSEKRDIGVVTRQYQAVARKNTLCTEYRITDTVVLAPPNPQIKPILIVEPSGVTECGIAGNPAGPPAPR